MNQCINRRVEFIKCISTSFFCVRFTCNFNLLLLKYLTYYVIKAGWSMTSPYNYLQTD